MGYTKEMLKKKEFVFKELSALLCKVDPKIKCAEYEYDSNNEVVTVHYTKSKITVDVTADSLGAVAQDVLSAVV